MLYYNIVLHAKPGFCRYMPHFNVFITEPVTTGLDWFFAVFCGPGPRSLISEAFWVTSGPVRGLSPEGLRTGTGPDLEALSVYTGISVISNRRSPSHRDTKGRPEWFDTLMSYSKPGSKPQLLIGDLGLNLEYSSGTIVNLCGSVLKHEVESWGDCDWVCYAHFMREDVRERLGVRPAGWVDQGRYLPQSDVKKNEKDN